MSYLYDPNNKFGYKDQLPADHPEKVIKGDDFDEEFRRIAGAFKILDPSGDGTIDIDNIEGLQDALNAEEAARINADNDLQGQIDNINGESFGQWEDVNGGIAYTDGNVGIGTDDPDYALLSVEQDDDTKEIARLRINGKTNNPMLIVTGDEAGNSIDFRATGSTSGSNFTWTTGGQQKMVLESDGKVGIDTDDPKEKLHVQGAILSTSANYASNQDKAYMIAAAKNYDGSTTNWGTFGFQHRFKVNSSGGSRITIDSRMGELWSMGGGGLTTFAETVRIGFDPATPAAFDLSAKEQLAEWKTKAKKASWEIVTDGEFSQEPTEELVEEFLTRVTHNGKLQVEGGASISGWLRASHPDAGTNAFAAGSAAGQVGQGDNAVAVGRLAGQTNQGINSVSVGIYAGTTGQGANSLAVGNGAGQTDQGASSVAVGNRAGRTTQGSNSVAVGNSAGTSNQGDYATAVGRDAGQTTQGASAVAIGKSAGQTNQGDNTVAVGVNAGNASQSEGAIALGWGAAKTNQGANSIAIGKMAGTESQPANSISISSSGLNNANISTPGHIILNSSTGSLRYNGTDAWTFAGGKVGIGTDNPEYRLELKAGTYPALGLRAQGNVDNGIIGTIVGNSSSTTGTPLSSIKFRRESSQKGEITFCARNGGTGERENMRIDGEGRVGISGTPGTRVAADYIEQASESIKGWTAAIKTRLDEEPEADKKAVTLEITEDFETLPTKEALAEVMAERAVGGGDAKFQVAGDGWFSGTVAGQQTHSSWFMQTNCWRSLDQSVGLFMGDANVHPVNHRDSVPTGDSDGEISLGTEVQRFKNGFFTGTVKASAFDGTLVRSSNVIQDGAPVIDAKGLITTLRTLRNATKDETTLEGMRDALADAIGGLIENLEHEIAAMPAPETGTMETLQ